MKIESWNQQEKKTKKVQYPQWSNSESHWWKKLVKIEGKRIELLASCICLEWPELVPPMHAPVLLGCTIFPVQCGVQEEGQCPRYKCFRREWYIDHIVELPKEKNSLSWVILAQGRIRLSRFKKSWHENLHYPSCSSMDRTITIDYSVFIEVLRDW